MKKNLTEKRLVKILTDLIPSYFFDLDKPEIKIENAKFGGATDEKEISFNWYGDRKIWFYFWVNKNKKFHVSMDGAISYEFLSTESEYFNDKLDIQFSNAFKPYGLYPHPNNHYSFTIDAI
jgi:hypothetical protein